LVALPISVHRSPRLRVTTYRAQPRKAMPQLSRLRTSAFGGDRRVGSAEDGPDAGRGDILVDADAPHGPTAGQRAFQVGRGTRVGSFAERVLGIVEHFDLKPEGLSERGEYRGNKTLAPAADVVPLTIDRNRAGKQPCSVARPAFL